jgi:IS1 family transposase
MNALSMDAKEAVVKALVDGASVRATERMIGVHRDTILSLMVRVGTACQYLHDETMRDLNLTRIEADEIWTFVGKKQGHMKPGESRRRYGDFWTWVAFDPVTKLIPAYRVGKRDTPDAKAFMVDLAARLQTRIQLSTDAHSPYIEAVEKAFGGEVDYGVVVKSYEAEQIGPGRYSPPSVTSVTKTVREGGPEWDAISTSLVERSNLTLRMSLRRFTRLTNGFSKKVGNLKAAVALYMAYYNLVRRHSTIRMTPAMKAGVTSSFWTVRDLIALAD